jgi:hypothetical protein
MPDIPVIDFSRYQFPIIKPIVLWRKALETRVKGNPNDYQAAKDMWLNRLISPFEGCGISINTDEIISNGLFVVDIINKWSHQIGVVFAHPNYRGNDRSTPDSKIWKMMIATMTRYMCQVRRERIAYRAVTESRIIDEDTYYTIIAVGRVVRFFALEAGSDELIDSSGSNGQTYDAFDDEEQIQEMFWELSRNNSKLR